MTKKEKKALTKLWNKLWYSDWTEKEHLQFIRELIGEEELKMLADKENEDE